MLVDGSIISFLNGLMIVLEKVKYTLWSKYQRSFGLQDKWPKDKGISDSRGMLVTMNHNQSGFKLDQDHVPLHLSKIEISGSNCIERSKAAPRPS